MRVSKDEGVLTNANNRGSHPRAYPEDPGWLPQWN